MRVTRLLSPLAGILVIAAVAATAAGAKSSATEIPDDPAASELRRIRAHFDSARSELAMRNVDSLPPAQRVRRAALLDTLRAYRDRGVFPHNYDFPGRAVPYFVDRNTGTLCAVAHLLAVTGRRDIVDRVARTDNNVWVPQLATDTAFAHWLGANGLTLAEAARIQVPYEQPTTSAERARNTAFLVAAPAALGGAAVASVWNALGNADGHSRVANVLGLTTGVMAIGMGSVVVGSGNAPRSVGAMSAALGAVSVALSARSIRRHNASVIAARAVERQRAPVHATLAPIVPTSAGTGAGLALSLRF